MPKYSFDVKLFTTIQVDAGNAKEARKILRELMDGAEANFGAYPNGDPIVSQVSMDDGPQTLIAIDGEDFDGDDDR